MQIKSLSLTNFKNIGSADLEFSSKVNCFVGDNGMGKSNLLDAIHYLSFCRSFSGMTDRQLIRQGEPFLTARAVYQRGSAEEELTLGIAGPQRKSLKRNGKEYRRITEHIGLYPLVMVSPADIDMARGGAEERRRWLDMVLSQGDAAYLDALVRYHRGLEQRNRMLRDHVVDHTLYEAVEIPMAMAATQVYERRKKRIAELDNILTTLYPAIAGEAEQASLEYESVLNGAAFEEILESTRRHDEILGHTSRGPHRDDIVMKINDMPIRRAGSQGQCKTFTVALRLAQFRFLQESTGLKPLLLLDDVFDKLDAGRVERILELVGSNDFGQIFVTDTNRAHIDRIIHRAGGDHRLWYVAGGAFTPAQA